uniref:DUF4140 domain-containing protein n=1 Tax=Panagrolaimus superbus TaxID=310955 RepID=A0A914XYY4_9BILA
MSSQPSITSFFAPEIPIKSVTVFTKGAEIHRTLKVSLKVGFNEIQILNVVETIKPNSIRVEGHGPATIHGVKLSNEYVYDETCNPQKLKDLKLLIKDLENQIENEKYYAKIYDTQIDVLNNAVKAIGNNQSKEGINPETMEKLFEYHENKYVETKIKAKKIQEKINSFDAEKCKIKVELNKYDSKCIRS